MKIDISDEIGFAIKEIIISMIKILKRYLPALYYFLQTFYRSSFYYKRKLFNLERAKDEKDRFFAKEAQIMEEVFAGEYKVFNGPFKGMKYFRSMPESQFLPKIMGSYEEPIHDWIEEALASHKYNNIVNIGCAEGYYAIGMAFRMPHVKITAYDIDEVARQYAEELKCANNVTNVDIKGACSHVELNNISKRGVLIICDIEGHEKILLDPAKAPNLKYVDIILESHDFIVPGVTDILIDRFYNTHRIRTIVNYPSRLKKYSTRRKTSIAQYCFIVDEKRPERMKYIHMESIV